MKKFYLILILFLSANYVRCDIRLPNLVGDNMVLQQKSDTRIWGWGLPAEKIVVTTSWDNKIDTATVTRNANWELIIRTPVAGGPYTIILNGSSKIVLKNVMIGEVWICSGQSNMEMNYYWGLKDIEKELKDCENSNIRFFGIPKTASEFPQDNCMGKWELCDSNSLKLFSAVGYFFGKRLSSNLNVPIGLIGANWSGTAAEAWTPSEVIKEDPELLKASELHKEYDWWPNKMGLAYNGMISPVTKFSIAGVIWYQGEGNTDTPHSYGKLLEKMIIKWRENWNSQFPFYLVQIAPYTYDKNYVGAIIREQQTKVSKLDCVGMVVINDLVNDVKDIHPINKHDVGFRIANLALAKTYNKDKIIYNYPTYKSFVVKGKFAIVKFDDETIGLKYDGNNISEIYIAGSDKIFHPAIARVRDNTLILSSPNVSKPAAIRYSFNNAVIGNLFSSEGLPVNPFRTDDWDLEF